MKIAKVNGCNNKAIAKGYCNKHYANFRRNGVIKQYDNKSLENEIWKPIKNYEELYEVSNLGRVRSLPRNGTINGIRILIPTVDKNGYLKVNLYKNNKMKTFRVNILVATAFIPNPLKLPQVNHKKEFEKANNKVDNLEWVSSKQNANYGTRNERMSQKNCKTVYQYSLDGVLIRKYNSRNEAVEENKFSKSQISQCCNKKIKQYHGFIWSYELFEGKN